MNGIYWLASYPKSGNTWVRTFLSNYMSNKEIPEDINRLEIPIASDRNLFDQYIGLSSADLDEDQIKYYQPYIYTELVKKKSHDIYLKVHDAYTMNGNNLPIIPTSVTKGVIYILRNPLDVAVSYAHHSAITIDKSIQALCNKSFTIARSKNKLNGQLHQLYLSWSGHIDSWIESPLRVHLMRYEDMMEDSYGMFKEMLKFMNIEIDENRLEKAVRFSSFDLLQKQEEERGFVERYHKSQTFFRKGKIGSYREELTQEQIETITEYHRETMIKYGYLDENNQLAY